MTHMCSFCLNYPSSKASVTDVLNVSITFFAGKYSIVTLLSFVAVFKHEMPLGLRLGIVLISS